MFFKRQKKSSMQDIEIMSWLFDILQSIAEIESYFDENYTFEMYVNDTKTKKRPLQPLPILCFSCLCLYRSSI